MKYNIKENKEKIIFWVGVLNLLLSLLYILRSFNIFIFCIIISTICFNYSKGEFKKFFLNPTIKNIIKLRKTKKILEEEVVTLNRQKQEIETFIKNKELYLLDIKKHTQILNEISFKEKKMNKNIIILKDKEQDLKDKINEEQSIAKIIEEKERKAKSLKKEVEKLSKEKEILEIEIKQKEKKKNFIDNATLKNIDNLDGIHFERFIMQLLKYLDFDESYTTKETNDYGIDVIAIKNNIKYAIQCKNYINPVGNKSIQEAYSGKDYYDCHVAIVATNSYFTNNAIKQASKNKVVLWDRDEILKMIKSI